MLCYALQRAAIELTFLAKPCQPNGHDDQMVLVDPLEGDELDTPTMYGHPLHGVYHRPAHDHDHNYNHGPDSHGLSNHNLTLGPGILCMWVALAKLSKMARLATIVASSS